MAQYEYEEQGFNSRLDALQAAVLRVKLGYLDEWNERRKRIANEYLKALEHCEIKLPHVPNWVDPVWHLFVVRHRKRDALQSLLKRQNIETLIHYPIPPYLQKAYQYRRCNLKDNKLTNVLSKEILSLPIGPHLDNNSIQNVLNAVLETLKSV